MAKEKAWSRRKHQHSQACFETKLVCKKNHEHNDASCWETKKICPLDQWEQI